MIRIFFLTLLLTISALSSVAADSPSQTLYLRKRFEKAIPGDYLVAYINKAYTVFHIFDRKSDSIVIEEITIAKQFVQDGIDWRQWVQQGAPRHTGWVMYEIQSSTGQMMEFYSFTQETWTALSEANSFLSTLLSLEFRPVRREDRKRVGTEPLPGDLDLRALWSPPATFQGQRVDDCSFTCWRTTWPADGGELAGKTIEAYLPESTFYPDYFPYWIEVRGNIVRATVRVKDAGKNMVSPQLGLPLRPPHFTQQAKVIDGMWRVEISTPSCFDDFLLIATPTKDKTWGEAIQIPVTVSRENRATILSIEENELKKLLSPAKRYRFTLSPRNQPRLTDQSTWTYQVHRKAT